MAARLKEKHNPSVYPHYIITSSTALKLLLYESSSSIFSRQHQEINQASHYWQAAFQRPDQRLLATADQWSLRNRPRSEKHE